MKICGRNKYVITPILNLINKRYFFLRAAYSLFATVLILSVLSAELFATRSVVQYILGNASSTLMRSVILTDLYSAIRCHRYKHQTASCCQRDRATPRKIRLQTKLNSWIPSHHSGIKGNELTDLVANHGSVMFLPSRQIPTTSYFVEHIESCLLYKFEITVSADVTNKRIICNRLICRIPHTNLREVFVSKFRMF